MCDMLINIRQSEVDFDTLKDIWNFTNTRRRSYTPYTLAISDVCYSDLQKYHEYHYNYVESDEILLYEQFIKDNHYVDDYYDYSSNNYKKLMKSYYLSNKKDMIKLENYKNFITNDFAKMDQFNNYMKNYTYQKEHNIYFSYVKHSNIIKNDSSFKLCIKYLNFSYPVTKNNSLYRIKI